MRESGTGINNVARTEGRQEGATPISGLFPQCQPTVLAEARSWELLPGFHLGWWKGPSTWAILQSGFSGNKVEICRL